MSKLATKNNNKMYRVHARATPFLQRIPHLIRKKYLVELLVVVVVFNSKQQQRNKTPVQQTYKFTTY